MSGTPAWRVLARSAGAVDVVDVGEDGTELASRALPAGELAAVVAADANASRWVWNDTAHWYPDLLRAGVPVERCHDLRLAHAILRRGRPAAPDAGSGWDAPPVAAEPAAAETLFAVDGTTAAGVPTDRAACLSEFRRHRELLAAPGAGALRLLVAAESAGALVAAEMHAAGVPWSTATHERLLVEALGARTGGGTPERIAAAAATVRAALGDPTVSLDSQPKLLRALHRAGVLARSTSKWELAQYDHPVIAPLLEYKRLMRLLTANGWEWMREWVDRERFRPVYVPGGVVTGRWASSGGGALQLPRQLRSAVRADPGWSLVVADVAQLEPRVLAAMAGDTALAAAARGTDLYAGIVASGIVATRAEAKVAMLGAMYGATRGDSGRLVPALRRAYPRAMRLVDEAAREGETGGTVATLLGRMCPPPDALWRETQDRAAAPDATGSDRARARRAAGDRGRFTRNFVVQGTAAEWALAWLADLRLRLAALDPVPADAGAPASGPVFARRAHLAFFLHDEIIVHTPRAQADAAAAAVRAAAAAATRLLFGSFPLDFPLDLRIADDAAKG